MAKKRGEHHRLPDPLTEAEVEEALTARREYMRSYMARRYRENPAAQKAANLRYWARKAAEVRRKEALSDE